MYGVSIQRYINSVNGLELAWEEIELGMLTWFKRDPSWLKSPKALRARKQGLVIIVVIVGFREEAWELFKSGLCFGGYYYKTEAYLELSPESVCICCCEIGHSNY